MDLMAKVPRNNVPPVSAAHFLQHALRGRCHFTPLLYWALIASLRGIAFSAADFGGEFPVGELRR